MNFRTENQTPTLEQLCARHKKGAWPDKGSVHSYIEVYEQLLAPYRHKCSVVLEVGLMSGESLRMWSDYFDNGKVYGIDCAVKPVDGLADLTEAIRQGYNISIGDAANAETINRLYRDIKFNVIIEDAGHEINQQLAIYDILKDYMAEGGIYIIEDVQDIDSTRHFFEERGGEVIDRRKIKNRYDDVLVIFKS